MQIDWLTVAAQIVNFLVLVWLLRRFLYQPITTATRRREEWIERRLAEANGAREEASQEAQAYRQKQEELETRKEEILSKAHEQAEDLRQRLEADIREDMEEKRAAWQAHLAEERDAFIASLQRQAGKRMLEITERVLSDYADTSTAERVVATFAERLKALDEETREKLADAASGNGEPALVQTGTKLESAAKARITRAIHNTLSAEIEVDYREDRDLVFGVRLTVGDYTVEWSATRYLKRLEHDLSEIIDAGSGRTSGNREKGKAEGEGETGADDATDRTKQEEDHETA